ncbi:TonB-dependent receptor domain-containing protein [Pontibacter aydingkolensis]
MLTALLCCFCIIISSAQTISSIKTIKGTVADSTTLEALGYVTVAVREIGQNQPTTVTLSQEDGVFIINDLPIQQYQLILSYVGYKTRTIPFPNSSSSSINFGIITLTSTAKELEEIHVITLKPLIEQSLDRTIYNVEADPDANALNTLDMLRKVPYLTVDAEDKLQLNGNSSYQIQVNGKRSALFAGDPSDILKTLPASSIKKIEVITTPSAKYEASGVGGIINIITHKKGISGYNGAVNLSAETPQGYTAGSFLSATAGKISISGRYNHRYSESPTNSSTFLRNDLINRNRLEQTSERSGKSRTQNISGELSYQLSSQDVFTASLSQYNSNSTNKSTQLVEQYGATNKLTKSYLNLNHGNGEGTGRDISLNYEHSFKKNDQQLLSISFASTNSANNSTSNFILKPLLNYTTRESTTNNEDETNEKNLQIDYAQPIGKQLLEFGLKSIFEENNSNYFYKNRDAETGTYLLDPSISNSFKYRQDVHAAYISLNLNMRKWGLRSGIRIEETRLDVNFLSTGTKAKQNYRGFFPNVTLSRSLKESSRINLSYNQRISRPGLYYLDPYIDLTDPLNISFGNPDLEPATSHTLKLEYSTFFKTTSLNANVFHTFTNNAIEQITTLGNDSVARSTFGNIGQSRNNGLMLTGNTTFSKKLSLNLNAGTSYITYTSMLEGRPQTNEGFTYSMRVSMNYRFGKKWKASGNLNYNSPNILLQGNTNGYTWSSISINKQFLKDDKASISLHVRSPFQEKRRNTSELVNPSFYQFRESFTIIRQYSLAFSYRFGKLR